LLFIADMENIEQQSLDDVAGGIWYGEDKRPTGERWAADVDRTGKRIQDALTPHIGLNGAGLTSLAFEYAAEGPARWGGRALDAMRGVK
jgi:hypothetical protein